VLVEDLGSCWRRVLLRAPNSPLHAACWFAVLKMANRSRHDAALRAKELTDIVTRAHSRALCDHRLAAELDPPRAADAGTVAIFGTNARGLDALAPQAATFANVARRPTTRC
jgi:2-aminobenzoate-CoA ligase